MYASMTAIGHQPPQFSTDGLTVEALLMGGPPNEPVARFVADLAQDRRGDPDTLLVLTYLLTHRTTTASRMAKLVSEPNCRPSASGSSSSRYPIVDVSSFRRSFAARRQAFWSRP